MTKISKPTAGIPAFYQPYMDLVPDDGNLLQQLEDIQAETATLIATLPEGKLQYRYAPGKWTIRDLILHLADCERVITYRAMRIARADKTELPGFDENLFVETADANNRQIDELLMELSLLRKATLHFVGSLDDAALDRTGSANGFALSARLLVNHIYGHHRHHLQIIKERYLN